MWSHRVSSIMSGRSPPLYCTLTTSVTMWGHQNKLGLGIQYFWTKISELRSSNMVHRREKNIKNGVWFVFFDDHDFGDAHSSGWVFVCTTQKPQRE